MHSTIFQQLTTDELTMNYWGLNSDLNEETDEDTCQLILATMERIRVELLSRPTELATRIYGA